MTEPVKRAPLEDLMVAMDVVDTLRHRDQLVERAANASERRESLLQQLRDIYATQGIEVTDAMLEAGVKALEENRFAYEPVPKNFSTRLARIYISRRRWNKRLLIVAVFLIIVLLSNYFSDVRPAEIQREQLPEQLVNTLQQINAVSQDPAADAQAQSMLNLAQTALTAQDYDAAAATAEQLQSLLAQLSASYEIRVVSRPGEMSGTWRIPEINPDARNYYLIVEAVEADGELLSVPIISEENAQTRSVSQWGIRVDETTFNAVGADKQDDGIIQNNIVGSKRRGFLRPDYSIITPGGMITEW